jgi:hypothetical protein
MSNEVDAGRGGCDSRGLVSPAGVLACSARAVFRGAGSRPCCTGATCASRGQHEATLAPLRARRARDAQVARLPARVPAPQDGAGPVVRTNLRPTNRTRSHPDAGGCDCRARARRTAASPQPAQRDPSGPSAPSPHLAMHYPHLAGRAAGVPWPLLQPPLPSAAVLSVHRHWFWDLRSEI